MARPLKHSTTVVRFAPTAQLPQLVLGILAFVSGTDARVDGGLEPVYHAVKNIGKMGAGVHNFDTPFLSQSTANVMGLTLSAATTSSAAYIGPQPVASLCQENPPDECIALIPSLATLSASLPLLNLSYATMKTPAGLRDQQRSSGLSQVLESERSALGPNPLSYTRPSSAA